MTAKLDPEEKRLRGLTDGQLADEVGTLKARKADAEGDLGRRKQEAIRRGLLDANGELFHIVLVPPATQQRLDADAVWAAFKPEYVTAHFTKSVAVDWSLKCNARSDAAAKRAA